jgi:hypothetical protein
LRFELNVEEVWMRKEEKLGVELWGDPEREMGENAMGGFWLSVLKRRPSPENGDCADALRRGFPRAARDYPENVSGPFSNLYALRRGFPRAARDYIKNVSGPFSNLQEKSPCPGLIPRKGRGFCLQLPRRLW